MDKLIELFTALSDKINIRIVKLLTKKMCTIFELSEIFEMPDEDILKHIDVLKKAGLISEVKEGKYISYFVKGSGGIFDKYTQEILGSLSKWFNSDEQVMKDYTKARMINRDSIALKRNL